MALIPCPHCGKQVSSKALYCPHCGGTIETDDNKQLIHHPIIEITTINNSMPTESTGIEEESSRDKYTPQNLDQQDGIKRNLKTIVIVGILGIGALVLSILLAKLTQHEPDLESKLSTTDDNNEKEMVQCIYDITKDGVPELWVVYGTCRADEQMAIYTFENGRPRRIYTGGGSEVLYSGSNYIIGVYGQMGYAIWNKYSYENGVIVSRKVFEEKVEDPDEYSTPKEPYMEMTDYKDKSVIDNAVFSIPKGFTLPDKTDDIVLTQELISVFNRYKFVDSYREGYARVKGRNGKYGFIDINGNEIIPCIYDDCYHFVDGRAIVVNNKTWKFGYINTNGDTVVPITNEMEFVGNSCAYPDGYMIPSPHNDSRSVYEWADSGYFQGDLEWYSEYNANSYISERLYGIRHRNGEIVIPARYCSHGIFHNGMATVYLDLDGFYQAYGYVDDLGNEVIPCQYVTCTECYGESVPGDFSCGIAHVCIGVGDKYSGVDFVNGSIDKYGTSTFSEDQVRQSRHTIQKLSGGRVNESIITNPPRSSSCRNGSSGFSRQDIVNFIQGTWEQKTSVGIVHVNFSGEYGVVSSPRYGIIEKGPIDIDLNERRITIGSTYVKFDYRGRSLYDDRTGRRMTRK